MKKACFRMDKTGYGFLLSEGRAVLLKGGKVRRRGKAAHVEGRSVQR